MNDFYAVTIKGLVPSTGVWVELACERIEEGDITDHTPLPDAVRDVRDTCQEIIEQVFTSGGDRSGYIKLGSRIISASEFMAFDITVWPELP